MAELDHLMIVRDINKTMHRLEKQIQLFVRSEAVDMQHITKLRLLQVRVAQWEIQLDNIANE